MPSEMRSLRLPTELNERVNEAAGKDFSGWARAAFVAYLDGAAASTGGSERMSPVRPVGDRADRFRHANALLAAKKRPG